MYAIVRKDEKWLNDRGGWGCADEAAIFPPERVAIILKITHGTAAFLVPIKAPAHRKAA